MPVVPKVVTQITDFWSIFGHSYVSGAVGSSDQTGRTDALFLSALDIEYAHRRNFAKSGSLLITEGRSSGGWSRVYQERNPNPGKVGPYEPDGGGAIFFWGINDLGVLNATQQVMDAFKHALRACISRWRASTIWEDSNANVVYTTGTWTNNNSTIGSGTSFRSNGVANSVITLTLPSDYKGEPIAISFHGQPGAVGGVVAFSGTAGVTGTISTSDIMPSATLSRCPVIKRITNLTAANAGQTIVCTIQSIDASGSIWFDCWWPESKSPGPVIVCNINRLTASGYGGYGGWTGTEAAKDDQVRKMNSYISEVVAEFDSCVQIADVDALINKNPDLTFDGIHPNVFGASIIVDAMVNAVRRITPANPFGSITANMNTPSPRMGAPIRQRTSQNWYSADCRGTGTSYTAVAGDMFATPFNVNQPRDRYVNFSIEPVTSVTGTQIRWGIYEDLNFRGYPQCLVFEATSGGTFVITSGTGVKINPSNPTAGSFIWIPDPGLYWIVVKFTVVGVTHNFRTLAGPSWYMPNMNTSGSAVLQASGYKLTGQGTGAFPTTFVSGAALSDNCPAIGIKLN